MGSGGRGSGGGVPRPREQHHPARFLASLGMTGGIVLRHPPGGAPPQEGAQDKRAARGMPPPPDSSSSSLALLGMTVVTLRLESRSMGMDRAEACPEPCRRGLSLRRGVGLRAAAGALLEEAAIQQEVGVAVDS